MCMQEKEKPATTPSVKAPQITIGETTATPAPQITIGENVTTPAPFAEDVPAQIGDEKKEGKLGDDNDAASDIFDEEFTEESIRND